MDIKKFNDLERETIRLPKEVLSDIADNIYNRAGVLHEGDEYFLHENKITSSDPEDGGADHVVVFKRKSDGKYFRFEYSDWDSWYNFDRDYPTTAKEVFAKKIEIIIFE